MSRYGEFIDNKCKELGISYNKIDDEAMMANGSTSCYVRGKKIPSVLSLIKTMMALGLSNEEIAELVNAIKEDAIDRGEIEE